MKNFMFDNVILRIVNFQNSFDQNRYAAGITLKFSSDFWIWILSKLLFFLTLYLGQIQGAPFQRYIIPLEYTEMFSGIPMIDAIYLINLDDRADRLAYMKRLLSKHQLHTVRVSAINGNFIDEEGIRELMGRYYKNNVFLSNKKRNINAGLGCLLSHLSALEDARIKNFQLIWILEDDVKILGDLSQIPNLINKLFDLDPDWDVLYTDIPKEASLRYPPQKLSVYKDRASIQMEERGNLFNLIHWRYGTYSMFISNKGIEKILQYFELFDIYGPIDNDIHLIPGIHEYSLNFNLVTHSGFFKSDIEGVK